MREGGKEEGSGWLEGEMEERVRQDTEWKRKRYLRNWYTIDENNVLNQRIRNA